MDALRTAYLRARARRRLVGEAILWFIFGVVVGGVIFALTSCGGGEDDSPDQTDMPVTCQQTRCT